MGSKHSLRLKLSSEAVFTALSLLLKLGVLCSYLSVISEGESVQAKIKFSGILSPSSIYFLIIPILALLVRHSTVRVLCFKVYSINSFTKPVNPSKASKSVS